MGNAPFQGCAEQQATRGGTRERARFGAAGSAGELANPSMTEEREKQSALEVHSRFYRALADGDFEAMDELWSRSEPVICGHPGGPMLSGRPAVMESWERILSQTTQIRISDARVNLIRGIAFINCLEHLGELTLAATNALVWENGNWRFAHHQASPLSEPPRSPRDPNAPLH